VTAVRRFLAGPASRVLAAVLVGASVGAAAKAYAAGGPTHRPLAGGLGLTWARVAATARAAAPALAWIALVMLVAVAIGAAARAFVLWRRSRGAAPVAAVAKAPSVVRRLTSRARAARGATAAWLAAGRDALRRPAALTPAPAARARTTGGPSKIHALAAAGATPAEIARRTGLPQDAVTLALSIAR